MSFAGDGGSPLNASGAMYGNVPAIAPSSVSGRAERVTAAISGSCHRTAMPKSRTLVVPSLEITTFALFRSRCTLPLS